MSTLLYNKTVLIFLAYMSCFRVGLSQYALCAKINFIAAQLCGNLILAATQNDESLDWSKYYE